jgi:hypothetical protein
VRQHGEKLIDMLGLRRRLGLHEIDPPPAQRVLEGPRHAASDDGDRRRHGDQAAAVILMVRMERARPGIRGEGGKARRAGREGLMQPVLQGREHRGMERLDEARARLAAPRYLERDEEIPQIGPGQGVRQIEPLARRASRCAVIGGNANRHGAVVEQPFTGGIRPFHRNWLEARVIGEFEHDRNRGRGSGNQLLDEPAARSRRKEPRRQ